MTTSRFMSRLTAAQSSFRAKMRSCFLFWDLLARSGLPAQGVQAPEEVERAALDPRDLLVQRARLEAQEAQVQRERRRRQVPRAHLVLLEFLDPQVRQELLDRLDPKEITWWAAQVRLVQLGCKVLPAMQEQQAQPDRKAPRAIKEMLARLDLQDCKVTKATPGQQDPQVLKALKEIRDLLDRLEARDQQDRKAQRVL